MDTDEGPASQPAGESFDPAALAHIPLHSSNFLTVLGPDGVVQYESPAIEDVLGFDQATLVGQPVQRYVHPEDRTAVADAFRTVVTSDTDVTESIEYRHERVDGSYVWVESVASANPTAAGNYVVNTREVTDRRARERELERTNERLDEFASALSHDLRHPLTVASLHVETTLAERADENLEAVARAHDRMETLIDDLLSLARSGRGVEGTEPVDLATVARTCWQTSATADATLLTEADVRLQADRSRLQQLLANLVRNAVEHGDADVTVTVGSLLDRPGFFVADDGPGIPIEDRGRVFDAGYSTDGGGTGLGLTIVRDVAEAHGWALDLGASDDGGARFEFAAVDEL